MIGEGKSEILHGRRGAKTIHLDACNGLTVEVAVLAFRFESPRDNSGSQDFCPEVSIREANVAWVTFEFG
jgi:hypothetical protein